MHGITHPTIAVAICTHNPRWEVFSQVVEALRQQTFSPEHWDLMIVDNASDEPIRASAFCWNNRLRVVPEARLGLTPARLAAIRGTSTDLIIFVDDDNLLCPDYLEQTRRIAQEWPRLGTWGGSITARYEEPPPSWLKAYECYLSVREVSRDQWFNLGRPELYGQLPYGAGLCVRRSVAQAYLELVEADEVRRQLDRRGNSLASSGDTDLSLVACDLGFGTGTFASLKLTHVIPKRRLTESYMEQLLREMNYSLRLLAAKRGHVLPKRSKLRQVWENIVVRRRGRREFRFYRAMHSGRKMADAEIRNWTNGCLN